MRILSENVLYSDANQEKVVHPNSRNTVWNFQDFCITQILLEINFVDSRSVKTPVFAIFGALNFINLVNFSLQKVQKCIKIQISPSKCGKWQILHF